MKYHKTCPVCGSGFATNVGNKKYCCYACYCASKHGHKSAVVHRTETTQYVPPSNMRKCHDCGKPTVNYRCEECWERVRKGVY